MKNTFFTIGLWALIGSITSSCNLLSKEDKKAQPSDVMYDNTPYALTLPFQFGPATDLSFTGIVTKKEVELGEKLFFDKRLSLDGTVSCASCHDPTLAFTDGLALSKGIKGKLAKRSSMPLHNLLWQKGNLFWDGRSPTLEDQALRPIQDTSEMGNTLENLTRTLQNIPEYIALFKQAYDTTLVQAPLIAKALAQFQRTLISSNSKFDRFLQGKENLSEEEAKGYALFYQHPYPDRNLRGANCGDCHSGALQTDNKFHNNGLFTNYEDKGLAMLTGRPTDVGKFRTPSLRNIEITAPYMHNGKFATLEEVLDHYNENIQSHANLDVLIKEASNKIGGKSLMLTAEEKKQVIAFLKTLTDDQYLKRGVK